MPHYRGRRAGKLPRCLPAGVHAHFIRIVRAAGSRPASLLTGYKEQGEVPEEDLWNTSTSVCSGLSARWCQRRIKRPAIAFSEGLGARLNLGEVVGGPSGAAWSACRATEAPRALAEVR